MGDHAQDAINESVDVWSGPGARSGGRPVCCRYCLRRAVEWRRTPDGWRLHDINGGPHSCNEYWRSKAT